MTRVRSFDFDFVDLPGRRSADPLRELSAGSSLRIVELETSSGRTAHLHPHSEEIVYVEKGSGHVWIEGRLHPVEPGDVLRIPLGAAHGTLPAPNSAMRLICFFPHPDLANNLVETEIEISTKGTDND